MCLRIQSCANFIHSYDNGAKAVSCMRQWRSLWQELFSEGLHVPLCSLGRLAWRIPLMPRLVLEHGFDRQVRKHPDR